MAWASSVPVTLSAFTFPRPHADKSQGIQDVWLVQAEQGTLGPWEGHRTLLPLSSLCPWESQPWSSLQATFSGPEQRALLLEETGSPVTGVESLFLIPPLSVQREASLSGLVWAGGRAGVPAHPLIWSFLCRSFGRC